MSSQVPNSQLPADLPRAIRDAKALLRDRIGDVAGTFADIELAMRDEVATVVAERASGGAIPVVRFSDVADGTVEQSTVDAIRRRGCAVVRETFPPERAREWDAELAEYLERNDFARSYGGPADDIFAGLDAGKPQIYPVYWSKPQIRARQHPNMSAVRTFLNSFWRHESEGATWFDPIRDSGYPDRIRRRAPGSSSSGLSPHTDSGSIERWLLPAYRQVFRHVFDGRWHDYDPWDAAYRTEVEEFPSTVTCSAFRAFQGWTALSEMRPRDGVLQLLPIPAAIAYVLVRALQDDVAEDDLCGAANGQALPITEYWHHELLPALTSIPAVEPGDTVWWHTDLIHAVGGVNDQQGWGNVMYIPSAPHCEKNANYAADCGRAFLRGASPSDFVAEDYEVGWTGRAGRADLNDTGRAQLRLV